MSPRRVKLPVCRKRLIGLFVLVAAVKRVMNKTIAYDEIPSITSLHGNIISSVHLYENDHVYNYVNIITTLFVQLAEVSVLLGSGSHMRTLYGFNVAQRSRRNDHLVFTISSLWVI